MNRIVKGGRTPRASSSKNSGNHVNSVKLPRLLLDWFAANARDLPWRRTLDPYAIWVSEIMLQQTQVKTVIPYFERWMRELPTIQSLASASSEKIHKLWEGLGYYTRVRNMQKAARSMVEKHNGEFPTNYDDVFALPGIGRYTAGAICSIAFNQPTAILDGNVIRVLTRVFGVRENAREKETNARLWQLADDLVNAAAWASLSPQRGEGLRVRGGNAERLGLRERLRTVRQPDLCNCNLFVVPAPRPGPLPVEGRGSSVTPLLVHAPAVRFTGSCSALNQSLMELGATVCTPRQPRCHNCPLAKVCAARKLGLVEVLPNLGKRATATARRFVACIVERSGAVLVRQRPAGVVNAHLWEFPNIEIPLRCSLPNARQRLETELGCALHKLTPFLTVKHTITRYRITLDVFAGALNGDCPDSRAGQWLPMAKARELSFTSAHGRILRQISGAA